jgi:hypothetical protein
METLTTREAVARTGAPNVAKFLRLAAANEVHPVLSGPGLRGAKFWNPADVDRLVAIVTAEQVAS